MLNLFKSTKIGFNISASIISIIFLAITFYLVFTESNPLYVFLLLILVSIELFLAAFIFEIIATKKLDKIIQILNNECDAVKYLNAYYPLTQKKIHKKLKTSVLLNLAPGYICVGDFTQAKSVLASVDVTKLSPMDKIVFYCHTTALNIDEGNIKEAEKSLDYLSNLISTTKILSIHLKTFNRLRNHYVADIKIENGYFDEVEQTLLGIIATSESMNETVSARYALAKLYIKQNRTDEAIKEMRFVAENGNTLAIAQKARAFLQTVNN